MALGNILSDFSRTLFDDVKLRYPLLKSMFFINISMSNKNIIMSNNDDYMFNNAVFRSKNFGKMIKAVTEISFLMRFEGRDETGNHRFYETTYKDGSNL